MYETPIVVTMNQIGSEIVKQTDDEIVYEIQRQLNVQVDKEELIRALNYDRDQYNRGYNDGKKEGYNLGYQKALEEMGMIHDNDTI